MRIRIDKYPVLLLSLLALFISCEKDLVDPEPVESRTIHYSAVVSEGSETRATLNGSSQYVFEAGDQLYVENTDAGNAGKVYGLLTLVSGAGERSAVFEGDLTCDNEYIPLSSTQLSATLIGASEHSIHHFTNGKLNTARSYPANEYATSLADAVSKYSDFTASSTYGAHSFTLSQQSAFLVFNVKFLATDVSTGTSVIASIKNDINDTNVTLRSGSVSATSLGEDHTQVAFVAAFPGGTTSLSDAALSVAWGANPERVLGLSDATLAANNYYTVTRSTFTYNGFRIRPATNETTTVTFKYNYTNDGIEYSTDEGVTWTHYTSGAITLPADGICVRGTRVNYKNVKSPEDDYGTPGTKPIFTATKKVYISGNIMSLLADKENLSESAFQGAFSNGTGGLSNIDIDPYSPLILPATTLASKCYMQMFRQCTDLTRAPTFTANAVSYRCCYNIFRGCSNLTDVSTISLPASTLAEDCYREMFRLCTSLTSVPTDFLPASTLAQGCYQQLFHESGITATPDLLATTLAPNCYSMMFMGCTGLTSLPAALPATTLEELCYSEMFSGCTGLTSLPSGLLPAETMAIGCYNQMFYGCNQINAIPNNFLPATTLAVACYRKMFESCTAISSVPSNLLSATNLANGCYSRMFCYCESLTTAPDLPATVAAPGCYFNIFRYCKKLNSLKCYLPLTGYDNVTVAKPADCTDTADPTVAELINWTTSNLWSVVNKWLNTTCTENGSEKGSFQCPSEMINKYSTGDNSVGAVPTNYWNKSAL